MPQTFQVIDDDEFDPQDELRPEYDFAALRAADHEQARVYRRQFVRLDPDVAEVFPDAKTVNTALRNLIATQTDVQNRQPHG
jgi:hypothetical protein